MTLRSIDCRHLFPLGFMDKGLSPTNSPKDEGKQMMY